MPSTGEIQQLDLLAFARLVIDALEAARVDYLLGGALAVSAWGEARSTQDIDLVVDLPVEQINLLSAELAQRDVHIPPDVILDDILETRGDLAITIFHSFWGHKAELFPLRPDDELRASALARRQKVDLGPPLGQVFVHSAEDLILYKLYFYSISQQTKHTGDIASVLLAQSTRLDGEYLDEWIAKKGLQAVWKYMLSQLPDNLPDAT